MSKWFEAGFSQAHCKHCDHTTPLNTAVWRMWLHLIINHPKEVAKELR